MRRQRGSWLFHSWLGDAGWLGGGSIHKAIHECGRRQQETARITLTGRIFAASEFVLVARLAFLFDSGGASDQINRVASNEEPLDHPWSTDAMSPPDGDRLKAGMIVAQLARVSFSDEQSGVRVRQTLGSTPGPPPETNCGRSSGCAVYVPPPVDGIPSAALSGEP